MTPEQREHRDQQAAVLEDPNRRAEYLLPEPVHD